MDLSIKRGDLREKNMRQADTLYDGQTDTSLDVFVLWSSVPPLIFLAIDETS